MRKCIHREKEPYKIDMLTASLGGVCALVGAKCHVCIPDVHHSVSHSLPALASETHGLEHLTGGPLQEWWASLTTEWQWGLAVLGGSACVLAACCCSLYCWCGIWVQGSALLVKRPSGKTPLCGLYGEEP